MRLTLKALAGGVLVPIGYLAILAGASSLLLWTHGDDHPAHELLAMPLVWPAAVISRVSGLYGVNVFEDYPWATLMTVLAADYLAYALVSYFALRWYEGRRRLA
jgi:hypothetical protein